MKNLLAQGVNINKATDELGNTPLMLAAEKNNTIVVTYLLKKGAKARQVNKKGESALLLAG